jgi:protease-4
VRKLKLVVAVLVLASLISFLFQALLKGKLSGLPKEKVAVVKIYGVIKSPDKTVKVLDELQREPKVKAVVLRIDSPGGVVGACQEIYEKVKKLKEFKPVVVSMGSVAASGALYISVGASKVVANPGTITGSIGVIIQSYNVKELAQKLGVKVVTVKSGKFKDLLNPFREPDPQSLKVLQELIDDSYRQFVKAVAEGRGLKVEEVMKFADGRVFSGKRAKELGLVDELGGLDRAVELAKELGKCPKAQVWEVKEKKGLVERLLGEGSSEALNNLIGVLSGDVKEVNLMYLFN